MSSVTSATTVNNASSATPGSAGSAAALLVLKKSMNLDAANASALIQALPQPAQPALATSGNLGTKLNTYA
ncbi:MAG: putative motility protein [Aquabacterium sp.]|nr:MAG: putative motility protein [Aquabacterium sp.]